MSILYENALFRIRHVGRTVRGKEGVLTPEVITRIDAMLLGQKTRASQVVRIPREALEALGVESAEELELTVESDRLVLTPRARPSGTGAARQP